MSWMITSKTKKICGTTIALRPFTARAIVVTRFTKVITNTLYLMAIITRANAINLSTNHTITVTIDLVTFPASQSRVYATAIKLSTRVTVDVILEQVNWFRADTVRTFTRRTKCRVSMIEHNTFVHMN